MIQTRKPCEHKIILPKGLRCNHGYLEIILMVDRRLYCRTFGPHTKDAEKLAIIKLAKKEEERLLGRFDMEVPIPRQSFAFVADLWFKDWSTETAPDGKQAHADDSISEAKRTIEKEFKPLFEKYYYDEIKPIDILRWRKKRLLEGAGGTSLNRYQATLSTMFSCVEQWIQTEQIKPAFRLPLDKQSGKVFNPCTAVEKAPNVKRERILTDYEGKKLKFAFLSLKDEDGWEICKLALKSVLSLGDLKGLELGQEIDINRLKTNVPVNIPLPVLVKLNWRNWRRRWDRARQEAGLVNFQFRDLRKTGINMLKGRHDLKLVSEYAGHADIKTTEGSYTVKQSEKMLPLAKDLDSQVEGI